MRAFFFFTTNLLCKWVMLEQSESLASFTHLIMKRIIFMEVCKMDYNENRMKNARKWMYLFLAQASINTLAAALMWACVILM